MSNEEIAREPQPEHLKLKLAQGLQTCRAMVENYRLMLGGPANDNAGEELTAQTEAFAESDKA